MCSIISIEWKIRLYIFFQFNLLSDPSHQEEGRNKDNVKDDFDAFEENGDGIDFPLVPVGLF